MSCLFTELIRRKFWAPGEPNSMSSSTEDRISLFNAIQGVHFRWNDEMHDRVDAGADYKALCQCTSCGTPCINNIEINNII